MIRRLLLLVFLLELFYIAKEVVLVVDMNWIHPEMLNLYLPSAIKNGTAPTGSDLHQSFDWLNFDGAPRARFLSNFFLIQNFKLRAFLLSFFPMHPSFSLNWVFTLLLSPLFLYRFLFNLTGKKETALIGLCLYFLCESTLAGTNMLFHPAKPLTNAFYLFILWLGSEIQKRNSAKLFVFSLVALFLGCFLDESAWFAIAVVPVLYPKLLSNQLKRPQYVASFAGVFATFLGFVTFVAPSICERLGIGGFWFWKWAVKSNDGLTKFDLAPFWWNPVYALWNHLVPFRNAYADFDFGPLAIAYVVAVLGYLVFLFTREDKSRRAAAGRLVILGVGFLGFQILLLTRHLHIIKDLYYYGGAFSMFFVLNLAILLSPRNVKQSFHLLLLVIILGTMARNYRLANEAWRGHQAHIPPITSATLREIWNNRRDLPYLEKVARTKEPYRLGLLARETMAYEFPETVKIPAPNDVMGTQR